MKKIAGLIVTGLIYACIATILAQAAGLAYLAVRGVLTRETMFQMAAALHGIDLAAIEAEQRAAGEMRDVENVSFEQVLQARALANLDRDLREQALKNAVTDMVMRQQQLTEEKVRYTNLRESFNKRLEELESEAASEAILEVQVTLEAMQPKQAKDHILIILDEEPEEDSMKAVVTIMIAMAIDKRKKILAEFKTDEEAKKLAEILREIRLGGPKTQQIDQARAQLREFDTSRR